MRRRFYLLVCLVIVATIVCSGFMPTFLENSMTVIGVTSPNLLFSAELQLAQFTGDSCEPEYSTHQLTLTKEMFVNMSNFMTEHQTAIAGLPNATAYCEIANSLCPQLQQEGETCDISYPPPMNVPVSITLQGYVVYVDLTMNNQLPLIIKTVQSMGERAGGSVQTQFASNPCDPHCTLVGVINISTVDTSAKSVDLTLIITAEIPIAWGFAQQYLTLGTTERTITVPLKVSLPSGLVSLGTSS